MALNSWQLISRVEEGKPFGTGADGALTISSHTEQTLTDETCTGTAASTALTAGGTSLSNGDLILIYQGAGTGEGQWEINKISSGGGTVNLVMKEALNYSYAAGAQVVKIPQYTDVTVNSGINWSAKAWASNLGGILLFAANGTTTITGNLVGTGQGFTGGAGTTGDNDGYRGNGSGNSYSINYTRNGSGSGGGHGHQSGVNNPDAGGGGGNAAAGSLPSPDIWGLIQTGAAVGNDELTDLSIGGGGGAGGNKTDGGGTSGAGGDGGSIILGFCKDLTIAGTCYSNGANGSAPSCTTDSCGDGGGGGAGGSVLFQAGTIDIGTEKIRVAGGSGNSSGFHSDGGAGSKGRISIHYGTSTTGSVNATYYGSYSSLEDTNLIETSTTLDDAQGYFLI